ncbi:hypothetical protein [Flavobacterium saccharophilum]|uniref:Uncharacterized protein n=1 Tax=Flavobacterium saccharophilum TaxID=29534 RepID=A0A1M7JFR7_9FLAO|nr:hypothetical protein [Flavobacterium saccharophilum]SHM51806.1 hypothetical protein SAMN05444366_3336 [Flavobacterium saccharophilum]
MYKTEHGNFDGNSWESFCQVCFKIKYEAEGYQEMPAWQGDLGIEGFTRNGILFQCYCPNEEYNPDKLYEEQRDKITTDLKKLIFNEAELKKYLKSIKVKQWIFVTPGYKKKDIVKHCQDKAEEYKKLNLSILDDDFDVLIYDIDFFASQIPLVLNYREKKIEINPLTEKSDVEIADWKTKQISLVDNAIRKHGQRINASISNRDSKINALTQNSIEHFLNGNIAVKIMQEKFPTDYEKFVRVVSLFEKKLTEICIVNTEDNNTLYKQIENDLKVKLKEAFSYIDQITIDRLTEQVLADWILRCPINFD